MTTTRDQIDACLRVVSNRCRNLRKTIDRAKAWQAAADKGQPLKEEQEESLRSIPRKEALLAELTEILKKQSLIIEALPQPAPDPQPDVAKSKRPAARPAKASVPEDVAQKPSQDEESKSEDTPASNGTANDSTEQQNGNTAVAAGADHEPASSASTAAGGSTAPSDTGPQEQAELEQDRMAEALAQLELKHSDNLKQTKTDSVRTALNFFHVVDFLRQPASPDALLSYFNSSAGAKHKRGLSKLDIDLLVYFNVMLTSPNGSVPHPEAVEVSTAHCLEFIDNSTSEAFKDTTYAALVEIVNAIATCPILTDRNLPLESLKDAALNGAKPKHIGADAEPGHVVEAATTEGAMP